MSRLTGVELRRVLARRITWVLLLGGLLAAGLMGNAALSGARAATPHGVERQFQQAHRDWAADGGRAERDCLSSMPPEEREQAREDGACAFPEPQRADFGVGTTDPGETVAASREAALALAVLLPFLLGASLVAAELSTGSMATWLTFEPRRPAVLASKLLAVAVASAGLTALVATAVGGASWAGAVLGGMTSAPARAGELLASFARTVPLGMLAGLLGACAAFVLRHTAAVVGVLLAGAVGEGIVTSAVPATARWAFTLNARAFVEHGTRWTRLDCTAPGGSCTSVERWHSFSAAAAYLAMLAVVGVAAAAVSFTRRDVT